MSNQCCRFAIVLVLICKLECSSRSKNEFQCIVARYTFPCGMTYSVLPKSTLVVVEEVSVQPIASIATSAIINNRICFMASYCLVNTPVPKCISLPLTIALVGNISNGALESEHQSHFRVTVPLA